MPSLDDAGRPKQTACILQAEKQRIGETERQMAENAIIRGTTEDSVSVDFSASPFDALRPERYSGG